MLKQWGRWVWLWGQSIGCYPRESAIVGIWDQAPPFSWFRARQLTARGRSTHQSTGHRALCEFGSAMPNFIATINAVVGSLSEEQYLAVAVTYAMGLDREGREYSEEEKALALGISVAALRERLRRARIKVGRVVANATGRRVDSAHRQSLASA